MGLHLRSTLRLNNGVEIPRRAATGRAAHELGPDGRAMSLSEYPVNPGF